MICDVSTTAYEIPTETEAESDGTLVWDSTDVVVVEIRDGDHVGLGYTYCHAAAALGRPALSRLRRRLGPVAVSKRTAAR